MEDCLYSEYTVVAVNTLRITEQVFLLGIELLRSRKGRNLESVSIKLKLEIIIVNTWFLIFVEIYTTKK